MRITAIVFFFQLLLISTRLLSQTVYINQSGILYHTKACKTYTKNFEAIPLWKAREVYQKKPCPKCHPPTKESSAAPAKKTSKAKTPGPAKK